MGLSSRAYKIQDAFIDQGIIDNDVGRLQSMKGQHREMMRIARASADEPDLARPKFWKRLARLGKEGHLKIVL